MWSSVINRSFHVIFPLISSDFISSIIVFDDEGMPLLLRFEIVYLLLSDSISVLSISLSILELDLWKNAFSSFLVFRQFLSKYFLSIWIRSPSNNGLKNLSTITLFSSSYWSVRLCPVYRSKAVNSSKFKGSKSPSFFSVLSYLEGLERTIFSAEFLASKESFFYWIAFIYRDLIEGVSMIFSVGFCISDFELENTL